jgi:3'-phosphoadenosine 5'-phosphosulfate sulfotransferase (PAPS reductase)/FAD synthetase
MSRIDPYRIEGPALIAFSGGRSSGYMLKHIVDAHGGTLPDDVKVQFSNTGREMPETLDFVQECSSRWNVPIVWLEYDEASEHRTKIVSHNSASRNGEPFKALIDNRGYLPNPVTRFCTVELKIRRSYSYAYRMLGWETWLSVVGFRGDEMHRVAKMGKSRERWTSAAPMAQAGVAKRDVMAWWEKQPFDLRLPNINGSTPMGNCDLCFLKGEATIRGIIREKPDLAKWWAEAEAEAEARASKPDGAKFRIDRPSYAVMAEDAANQSDMFDDTYEDDRDCNCTD